jgi:hypothetical protein
MATSYSANLALALPATGELSGTWGTTVNSNITNMLDEALGYQAYSATGGADTITIPDGTTGVARSIYIQLNGTGGGSVAVPTTKTKMYFVFNNTASAITFKVTGQTGVSIPAAAKMALVSNGTDIIVAQNYFAALTLGAALPVLSGGTGVTTSTGTGSNVLSASPTLTGTVAAASLSLSSLTSGRVTYAGTAGLLQDSANLTFSGTALAVTGTLSATGAVNFTGPSLTLGAATVYDAIVNTTESMYFNVDSNNDQTGSKFQWGENRAATTGGTTFATLDATGLAVTGTLSTTSASSLAVPITLTGSGADPSAATRYIGSGASSGYLFYNTPTGSDHRMTVNGAVVSVTSSTGLAVTGLLTSTDYATASFGTTGPLLFGKGTSLTTGAGANDSSIRWEGSSGNLLFSANATEKMRLDSSGNLGIGTTSGSARLNVNGGTSTSQIRFEVNDATFTQEVSTNAAVNAYVYKSNDASYHVWLASSSEKMRLDSSGNLGIGTSSPAQKLDVLGSIAVRASTSGANQDVVVLRALNSDNSAYANAIYYGNSQRWCYAGATEGLRLDSSGNLGLGVTPSAWSALVPALQIGGAFLAAQGTLSYSAQGANAFYNGTNWIYVTTATASVYQQSAGVHSWQNAASGTAGNTITFGDAKMTLTTAGDLLVGTTSAGLSGVTIYNAAGNSNVGRVDIAKSASGAATAMTFRYVATAVGSITYDNTSTGFNTSSDYRLKDNIQNAPDVAELIDAIQVRQFNWKAGGSHQRYGFIAQELVTVAPEAVYTPTDPDEMMAVDYSKLVPLLVKELQSLRARVAQLESNQ